LVITVFPFSSVMNFLMIDPPSMSGNCDYE
jgi:hypothetical protein